SGRTSGTLSGLIGEFCNYLNVIRLPEFEIFSHATVREANEILFNHKSIPFYNIEKADLLITLGADIVETFVSPVSYSNMISRAKERSDFRWFHVEPHISLTGVSSTMRLAVNSGSERFLLLYLIKNLNQDKVLTAGLPDITTEKVAEITGLDTEKIGVLLKAIRESKRTLVIAGGVATENENGLEVALLAGLLNYLAGGTELMDFSRAENYENVGTPADLIKFAEKMVNEKSGVLFISRTNPLKMGSLNSFKKAIDNCLLSVGITEFMNDTMKECDIILPLSDPLESWGDAEGRKGIRSVIQPATSPLFDTLTEGDILLNLMKKVKSRMVADNYQEYLLKNWKRRGGEEYIKKLLTDGVVIESVEVNKPVFNRDKAMKILKQIKHSSSKDGYSLVISPSLRTYDGAGNSTPLYHEVPDPLTSISYGEWACVSEKTAEELGIEDGDSVEITEGEKEIRLSAKVMPGLKNKVLLVHREFAGAFGGVNGSGDFLSVISGVKIEKSGKKIEMPVLAGSIEQEGRGIIPEPDHREHGDGHGPRTLYPEPEHKEYRWAMVIDLELCTGCSACVAACYIENNVPVTGEKLHLQGRELSWIRIESYFDNKDMPSLLPMLCQQCSYAPCESVCPVYATYHNPDGLNAQVYNRCVGTRYCANNCPYKVRRFNWFNFKLHGIQSLQYNPDVWVRPRGVMEKCTFCIQRIRRAKDKAKDEGRMVKDGEVIPACAQTCPANAITFGNILDKESKVYKLANSGRAYRIFEQLGTEPAVYYLKKKIRVNL
ncbi:MAG: 4Fe-4S dicluster domain-containing protein, partial [Halobacteria archaeon]